jgi:hypothetical protein
MTSVIGRDARDRRDKTSTVWARMKRWISRVMG